MIEERHTVPEPGARLALALHLPEGRERVPLVLACHGLRASKDSDKYLRLGAELPAAGFALARFDFRGSGESTGSEEESTVGTRLEDARAVLTYLAVHRRLDGRIGLLGSSLGGYVALHLAAERRKAFPVVTWNAPANLDDLAAATADDAPALGDTFVRELAARVYAEAPAGVPRHLIIQAEADDLVTVEHGATLFARAAEPCDLIIIPGADHRLTDPAHRKEALARSLEWFVRFLGG
ncbi:MAG: alpha/beta hydrolase family protein [Candidatus Rokuibacteriota bacterium]